MAEIENGSIYPNDLFSDEDEAEQTLGTPTGDVARLTDEKGTVSEDEMREQALSEAEQVPEKERTVRIKFNGEPRDIPLSEAITLAQKGLNYDHVVQQRDRFKNENAILDEYAAQSGMTREQYIEYLKSSLGNIALDRQIAELRDKYPDADEGLLRDYAEQMAKYREADFEREKQKASEQEQRARREPWNAFFKEFPDIAPEQLSQDFYDRVADGTSPTEVYLRDRIKTLEDEREADRKNRDNERRSVGSARGDGEVRERDAFLEGFME